MAPEPGSTRASGGGSPTITPAMSDETLTSEPDAPLDAAPSVQPTGLSQASAPTGRQVGPLVRKALRPVPLLSAGLVLSLVLAGWMGLKVRSDNRLDDARREAIAVAQTYAVNLTTYDHAKLDEDFARVLEGSTGSFRTEYTAASESLRALIAKFKATATGKVLNTAVLSVSTSNAELLLFVDQTVNNSNTDAPRIDRTRMRMGLEKQDGRWLISALDLV